MPNSAPGPSWRPPFLPLTEDFKLLYSGRIREGTPGTLTRESYNVWKAVSSELGFLDPMPLTDYSSDAYRVAVNDSAKVSDYFRLHDSQQIPYLQLANGRYGRESVVADCGCGAGSLLDLIRGMARETIAIEPFAGYHDDLKRRGHTTYSDLPQAVSQCKASVDLALSIHVIEHTTDPVGYLRHIHDLLKPGGTAIIVTPNLNDILLALDPTRFAPFFFRRVHNYYFTLRALRHAIGMADLVEEAPIYLHEFGISNCLLWLKNGAPSGRTPIPHMSSELDAVWQKSLESQGLANQVGIVAKRRTV